MANTNDLNIGLSAIGAKQAKYTRLWDYYDGDHPLRYSTSRLIDIFGHINARFCENWIQVVVDAAVDRIEFDGFNSEDEAAKRELDHLVDDLKLKLDADDVHLAALVTGEGFLIGEVTEAGKQVYYNDPRMVHMQYEADNPKVKRFACKLYQAEPELWAAVLYYADRVERYESRKKTVDLGKKAPADQFTFTDSESLDAFPVFHFRVTRRKNKGDIETVLTLQDAVNKLLADMMVSAEFSAFRQRWIISNADDSTIVNAPNQIITIPAGDGEGQPTTVGEFSETNLEGFLRAVDRLAQSIAIITRTPKHYLFAQGGDPSGEALVAMEAPLIRRCQNHIERFSVTWEEVADWLLMAENTAQAIFAPVATVQPRTSAEIREINARAGIPIVTTLRDEGWTKEELEQMDVDRKVERSAAEESEARLAASAISIMDRGGNLPE